MLTGKQKQYLKALAVQLPAVVQIGKDGMSETVIQSVDDVLTARELIKVKINQNSDEDIKSTALYLAGHLSCEIVQIIGLPFTSPATSPACTIVPISSS